LTKTKLLLALSILLAVLTVTTSPGVCQTPQELFTAGNQHYANKEYAEAIDAYRQVQAQGLESARLYYNLGNACFKHGDLGHAIANYIKARRLDPDDEDIIHNLEFARQFTAVQMEGVRLNPIDTFFGSIVGPYTLKQLAWLSSIFFVLFVIALIFRWGLRTGGSAARGIAVALAVLLVVSSILTTYKYRHDYLRQRAVIVAEESPVYTGPSEKSEIELQGAPGLVVEVLAEKDGFYNVQFENQRRGWIDKDLVAVV
jgi:tetratricopeptide (TPR) repeat protein